jgi:hypothetical protein
VAAAEERHQLAAKRLIVVGTQPTGAVFLSAGNASATAEVTPDPVVPLSQDDARTNY